MAQHRIKYLLAAGGLAAAITAGASGDAFAFTETTVAPARPQAAQPAPAAPLDLQKPDSEDSLALVKPGDSKPNGTELRIPGIGSLGTLPKLDFGLDLLYGQDSDQQQNLDHSTGPKENEGQDVTIKGTIRHRF
jgi:hypothetical protein